MKNFLVTGVPGIGKTTLIRNLCEHLASLNPEGFYTEEIREGGIRKGFAMASLDGKRSVFSHVNVKSRCQVGNGSSLESCPLNCVLVKSHQWDLLE